MGRLPLNVVGTLLVESSSAQRHVVFKCNDTRTHKHTRKADVLGGHRIDE